MEEIRELTDYYGEERTIIRPSHVFRRCGCKIYWIKKHEPDVYKQTYKFLTGSSYLAAKLTGNYVVDRFLGMASLPAVLPAGREHHEELCQPAGLNSLQKGQIVTEPAGTVTQGKGKKRGLKRGNARDYGKRGLGSGGSQHRRSVSRGSDGSVCSSLFLLLYRQAYIGWPRQRQ